MIVQNLKHSAPGHDEITTAVLQLALPSIRTPLVHVMNLSLAEGIFPDELKVAKVPPLYKGDKPMLFNNYRSVSLLNIISKVFEKVMYTRLVSFLENQKILYNKQFGFRKLHSTYMALMLLIDKLTNAIEKGEYGIGVFLDFSKAFDTVDHTILLSKLYHYGIRGSALSWFSSYLSNRKQYVSYNNVSSNIKTISCGVPQGSVLGPVLFLLYINDIANVCKYTMPFLFADDSNLFSSGKGLSVLQNQSNEELQNISKWLKVNKLFLNIKKTHFFIFSGRKVRNNDVALNIDGISINEQGSTKFLSVLLDNKLNWKKHIDYLSRRLSRGIPSLLCTTLSYIHICVTVILYGAVLTSQIWKSWLYSKNESLELFLGLDQKNTLIHYLKNRDLWNSWV